MRVLRLLLATVLLFLALGRAEAGQFVNFKSGETTLAGYLARPAGSGPSAAIVLLHGCGGFHSSMMMWADMLARWGYVAFAVDSLGPRGMEATCASGFSGQPADAYAALSFLVQTPFVRADSVALMGFSMGGGSTLFDLEQGAVGPVRPDKFRAGIAFYPSCLISNGMMTVPTLILIGQLDDWTPASDCEDMVAGKSSFGITRASGDRSNVKLIVYPGAYHAYDITELGLAPPGGFKYFGHRLEYNEAATKDSISQVREFLKRTLSD